MVTNEVAPGASSQPSREYWLPQVGAVLVALIVSVCVSILGHREGWPHSQSIAFGTFLFLIPILSSLFHRQRSVRWPSRIASGLVYGLVGGLIHSFFLD